MLCTLEGMGNKNRDQDRDRRLGRFWERKFGEIIVPLGFSFHRQPPPGIDGISWGPSGTIIYVQIRHKEPWDWPDIGECYGYERYRLNKDVEIARKGECTIYVIHDHRRYGRDSQVNDLRDWFAQDIEVLFNTVDIERRGKTYYGDSYIKLPICYWKVDKFEPLESFLISWRERKTR